MSVLRRVKLRTPDGIESIEYPLGVDAENVEVANGENLSQRLARIDEDLEKNEEDIAAVSKLAGTNKQNIGANEIRIDALERRSTSVDKKPYYFNTVADMKAYQKLKVGDMAITLGYYEKNDGGGAEYIIRTSMPSSHYELIRNGLYAELIIKNNKITPQLLGAKGNGITDDTIIMKKTIELAKNKKYKILLYGNYLISDNLVIDYDKFNIEGITNASIIQSNNSKDIITIDRPNRTTFNNCNLQNISLIYSSFGSSNSAGLRFTTSGDDYWGLHNSTFKNITITNAYYGLFIDKNEPIWNCRFDNIIIYKCVYQGVFYGHGFGNYFDVAILLSSANEEITRNTAFRSYGGGIFKLDIEDWTGLLFYNDSSTSTNIIKEFHIERCTMNDNHGSFVSFGNTCAIIKEINAYNCNINSATWFHLIRIYGIGEDISQSQNIVKVGIAKMSGTNKADNVNLSVINPTGSITNLASLDAMYGDFSNAFYPWASENTKANCFYKYSNAY